MRKPLIGVVGLVAWWGVDARAEEVEPPAEASASAALSDEDLLRMAEAIEIFDERPDKPFDRDTQIRLTGE